MVYLRRVSFVWGKAFCSFFENVFWKNWGQIFKNDKHKKGSLGKKKDSFFSLSVKKQVRNLKKSTKPIAF